MTCSRSTLVPNSNSWRIDKSWWQFWMSSLTMTSWFYPFETIIYVQINHLQVHVERGRLQSFLQSAETLKVHGLCDTINPYSEFNKVQPENSNVESAPSDVKKINTSSNSPVLTTKKIKRNLTPKPVTTTISPAFPHPLRPSSRNSPKPGPSNRTTESPIAVKVEEPNFSDEENHPEHVVIPSDPNSIGGKSIFNAVFAQPLGFYL